MALNPNWPVTETGWGPYWDAHGGEVPPDRYVEVRPIGQFATGRGRQYQLDQVQAGTSSMVLPNQDGSLDPDNAAGPFAGRIKPFQPIRRRAQWPPTINLLNQAQATGGDVGGQPLGAIDGSDTGPRILTDTDISGAFVASGTAWQGATVAQFAVGPAALAATWICYTAQPAALPGQTYTVQLRVRNITPGTTVQVAAGFRTRTATDAAATTAAGSTASLVGSATAAWTQITLTATAAANSASLFTGVQVVTAPGSTAQVQVDGWQLEKGASASAWVQPGVWYSVMSQFVEKWPAGWLDGGTRGIVQPTGVDAFALLSQFELPDVLTAEIQSRSPRFLFRLDDPAGSDHAAEATGAYAPAPVLSGKAGASSITFGTTITATDTVTGVYASSDTVARFSNPSPGQTVTGPSTFLSLSKAGIAGPPSGAAAWTRMIAVRYTGTLPTVEADIWCALDRRHGATVSDQVRLYIDSFGFPNALVSTYATGTSIGLTGAAGIVDANWHLVLFGYDPASNLAFLSVDGTYSSTFTASSLQLSSIYSDAVGAFVDGANGNSTTSNFKGDVSFVAEFPSVLTSTDCTQIYTAWKAAGAGESTDARYARILRYAGYHGPTRLQAGLTTNMGPADIAGQDALSALQAVVDTENGAHYVDGAGVVHFNARSARYNQLTPVYVFGERADLGEFPYEDCQPDYDSTHLGGIVQVTQASTGQVFTATDAASVKAYFPRTLPRTVNAANPLECQDAASYLRSRFAQPSTRVAALKLHPSAYPALWPVCLSLEQGVRVRVMRRPLGAPPIQIEGFVEKLDWTQDDQGEAVLILQCSRADTLVYGRFAAWHTTLKVAAAAGATTITVNASQDNVNPLAAQLLGGQSLVLGQGTANQETVTLAPGGVGATTTGWTSAVLTLSAATTKAHAIGDWVNQPLPTGTTDPTALDGSAAFNSIAFAY